MKTRNSEVEKKNPVVQILVMKDFISKPSTFNAACMVSCFAFVILLDAQLKVCSAKFVFFSSSARKKKTKRKKKLFL